jgi:N-acetyl-beta-hexosaminidase
MPGGALRPDTIVMAWRGMDIARRAAEAGHEVIACPVVPTYFDYYQADDAREPSPRSPRPRRPAPGPGTPRGG